MPEMTIDTSALLKEIEFVFPFVDMPDKNELLFHAGSRYFCESFFGHPCPTSGKNYATANAFGGPSRPASLVAYPTRGMQHRYRNDSTRFRKACIFTTQKTLRENTCPIASGDYSTPVSQRWTDQQCILRLQPQCKKQRSTINICLHVGVDNQLSSMNFM